MIMMKTEITWMKPKSVIWNGRISTEVNKPSTHFEGEVGRQRVLFFWHLQHNLLKYFLQLQAQDYLFNLEPHSP
jgi:hypothetical protein